MLYGTKVRTLVSVLALVLATLLLPGIAPAALAADAARTNATAAPQTRVHIETVANGLVNPWGLQFLPDGRMLVTERPGRLRIIGKDGRLSPPVAGVPQVHARGQGGLLDVRLAVDFASSGTIYLSFAEPRGWGTSATTVAAARLDLAAVGGGARLVDVRPIFQQQPAQRTSHHYGSRIVPAKDGTLFVTTGDRGLGEPAQRPEVTIGKVIRINPDGSAPKDNPRNPGWAAEVWSIGHRNIQGAIVDPGSGQLWTVEHGARGGDELNAPQAGRNYGWPVISYGRNYDGSAIGVGSAQEGMEQPVYYWDPSIATSGLALYDGELFKGWKGNLLVGGLAGARLVRLVMEGGQVVAQEALLAERGERIRDVRVGPDGAVYLLVDDDDGKVLRLMPAS